MKNVLLAMAFLLTAAVTQAAPTWKCPPHEWQAVWEMREGAGLIKAGGWCPDGQPIGDGKTLGLGYVEQAFFALPGSSATDWLNRADCYSLVMETRPLVLQACAEIKAENARQYSKTPPLWVAHGSWIPALKKTQAQLFPIVKGAIDWTRPMYEDAGGRCDCRTWHAWTAQPGASPALWCSADLKAGGELIATHCRKP